MQPAPHFAWHMRRGGILQREWQQHRRIAVATIHDPITSRRETAPHEGLRQRRHRACDGRERCAALVCLGQRLQQQPGIRVLRRTEKLGGAGHLDDLPGVHQRHPLRHAGHHRQIVRDQEQAHALLALQLLEQFQDLRLDRDIERGGRLIGHQKSRLGRQGDGDHHPLLLPTAHAKRVVVDAPLGLGDANAPQPFDGLRSGLRAAQRRVRLDRLGDLIPHPHDRVQAGGRLLEDHADAPPAQPTHRRFRQ